MPGFDGTGPQGMGPQTGGGRGFCSPGTSAYAPGYTNSAIRGAGRGGIPRGGGRGRVYAGGRGCGWRREPAPYYASAPYAHPFAAPEAEQEINFLKNQATLLEQELSAIRKRLDEIETKAES